MVSKKLKLGILGCGRVCRHYLEKILTPERVGELYEVVACCDVDEIKSKYVAETFSCKPFNDINEFIQYKGMEIVVILTIGSINVNKQHYLFMFLYCTQQSQFFLNRLIKVAFIPSLCVRRIGKSKLLPFEGAT